MKKSFFKIFFVVLVAMFSVCDSFAQDIIVKKDGTIVKANVTEVGETAIKYKKFESTADRIYSINVENVMSITYENGEVENFSTAPQKETKETSNAPSIEAAAPAANNEELIARYNPTVRTKFTPNNKVIKDVFLIMGVSEKSVLSTEDVEVSFISSNLDKIWCPNFFSGTDYHDGGPFQISIQNKSNDIIYIDLGTSFRSNVDGESLPYFDNKIITTSEGKESGGSFNLGGVTGALGVGGAVGALAGATTIGGSKTSSVSTTEQMQRVIAIPPHGSKKLSVLKMVKCTSKKCVAFSMNESLPGFPMYNEKNGKRSKISKHFAKEIHEGEVVEYTPETSIGVKNYHITYTKDPNFMHCNTISFDTYIKYAVGVKGWSVQQHPDYQKKMTMKVWNKYFEGDLDSYIYDVYDSWYKIGSQK